MSTAKATFFVWDAEKAFPDGMEESPDRSEIEDIMAATSRAMATGGFAVSMPGTTPTTAFLVICDGPGERRAGGTDLRLD